MGQTGISKDTICSLCAHLFYLGLSVLIMANVIAMTYKFSATIFPAIWGFYPWTQRGTWHCLVLDLLSLQRFTSQLFSLLVNIQLQKHRSFETLKTLFEIEWRSLGNGMTWVLSPREILILSAAVVRPCWVRRLGVEYSGVLGLPNGREIFDDDITAPIWCWCSVLCMYIHLDLCVCTCCRDSWGGGGLIILWFMSVLEFNFSCEERRFFLFGGGVFGLEAEPPRQPWWKMERERERFLREINLRVVKGANGIVARGTKQMCRGFRAILDYFHSLIRSLGRCVWGVCDLTCLVLCECRKVVRLSIAQVLTVISQKQKAALREVYKNKKYLPLDLRPKKTRAIRRRLTKHQVKF